MPGLAAVPADTGAPLLRRDRQNRLTRLDLARLGLLGLGQHEPHHAVLHLGADLTLVNLVGDREAARALAAVVFGSTFGPKKCS